jgi:hypothetical protein
MSRARDRRFRSLQSACVSVWDAAVQVQPAARLGEIS